MKKIATNTIAKKTSSKVIGQVAKKKLTAKELRALFEVQLGNLYWSEQQLVNLLPSLMTKATSYELTQALDRHLTISQDQILKLIHVFEALQERALGLKCSQMVNFLAEGEEILIDNSYGYENDLAIITLCQKINDYEIALYTELKAYAISIDELEAANYLGSAIDEEINAHTLLSHIALSSIYFEQAG